MRPAAPGTRDVKLAARSRPIRGWRVSWSRPTRGLGQLEKATAAQEIVARDRDSAGAYATLATLAYQAGKIRMGDLARDKALELTEPDMRESLKGQLDRPARPRGAGLRPRRAPTPTPTPAEK